MNESKAGEERVAEEEEESKMEMQQEIKETKQAIGKKRVGTDKSMTRK